MKKQVDKRRKESKAWKKEDKVMYKRLGVQRMTSKKVSGPVYRTIYN